MVESDSVTADMNLEGSVQRYESTRCTQAKRYPRPFERSWIIDLRAPLVEKSST